MLVRLLEVPADRLVVLDAASPTRLSSQSAKRSCSSARVPFKMPPVGRVADQHVVEAQRRLAEEPAGVGLDQLAPPQRLEARVEIGDLARQQMRDGGARELPPDDRGALEHRALLRTQPLDAGGEQRLDGGRHLEVGRARPPVVQRSPSRLSAPSCTSMRTSSPTKSGLPSLDREHASGDRGRQLVGADRRWRRGGSRRRRRDRRASRRRSTRPPGTASDERASRSSGRAATSTSSGTSVPHCTRCSTRSSSSGSAHCRSSISEHDRLRAWRARRGSAGSRRTSPPAPPACAEPARRPRSRCEADQERRPGITILDRRAHGVAAQRGIVDAQGARAAPSASGANVAPPAASQCALTRSRRRRAGARARRPSATSRGRASRGSPRAARRAYGDAPRRTPPSGAAARRRARRTRVAGAPGRRARATRRGRPRRSRRGPSARAMPKGSSVTSSLTEAPRRLADQHVAVLRLLLQARRDVHRIADDVGRGRR